MLDSLRTSSGLTLRYTYLIYLGRGHFVKVPWFLLTCSCVEHHLHSCTSGLNVYKEWKLYIILPTSSFLSGHYHCNAGQWSQPPIFGESWEPTFFVIHFPHLVTNLLFMFSATIFTIPLPTMFILIVFTYIRVSVCPQKRKKKKLYTKFLKYPSSGEPGRSGK